MDALAETNDYVPNGLDPVFNQRYLVNIFLHIDVGCPYM